MSKNIRRMMTDAAPRPDAAGKDAFIRMYREKTERTELSALDIIKSQFSYIRMPVWLVSIAALVVAIFGINQSREAVFIVAAIMPLSRRLQFLTPCAAECTG